MNHRNDRRLVIRALRGDKDAFTELILASEKTLYGTALSLVKNSSDASDAIQDAILEAYEKLDTLRNPEYFRTWLIRILIHKCYALLQRASRQIPMEFTEAEGGVTEECPDTSLDVRSAMDSLSDGDRLVLSLFYLEDIPIKEIASMLGISPGAVKTRLTRSRAHFKTAYGKEEPIHETAEY